MVLLYQSVKQRLRSQNLVNLLKTNFTFGRFCTESSKVIHCTTNHIYKVTKNYENQKR